MIEKDKLIKVTNRTAGQVGYKVPDLGIRRIYNPKETKEVTMEEVRKLSYTKGGINLLTQYLIIRDEEAAQEILPNIEPEYYYDEDKVREVLLYGSLDALLDCLDFAPEGVLDLVKKVSVEIQLNDMQKRQAIFNKLGFNVTRAIENSGTDEESGEMEEKKTRRVAVGTTTITTNPTRRAVLPLTSNNKIIDQK